MLLLQAQESDFQWSSARSVDLGSAPENQVTETVRGLPSTNLQHLFLPEAAVYSFSPGLLSAVQHRICFCALSSTVFVSSHDDGLALRVRDEARGSPKKVNF